MIRVVADTNIYISALMFGGLPGTVLDLGLAGAIQLIASAEILDELNGKLRGKFRVEAEDATRIRLRLEQAAEVIVPGISLDEVPDDPDDNRILECAVVGRADAIISGDRHLLRLGSYAGIPIMTARRFLEAAGVPC